MGLIAFLDPVAAERLGPGREIDPAQAARACQGTKTGLWCFAVR